MSKQKNISKQVKLFVKENRGGTIRRVDKSSKLMSNFLLQHFNRWVGEVMELNKEAIEAGKKLTDRTLQIPSQEIPEKTYDMMVKSLKPAIAGAVNGQPSFIIFMDTPKTSHPLVRFVRVKEGAKKSIVLDEIDIAMDAAGLLTKSGFKLGDTVELTEEEAADRMASRLGFKAKVAPESKEEAKLTKAVKEIKRSSRGNILVDQADVETIDIAVIKGDTQ